MAREMKETGIEWIGAIPKSWRILHCNAAFVRKNQKAEQENPVVLSLARSGVRIRDISNNEGQIAESYYNYNPVEPGDLLLNTMDLVSGANCSISQVSGVISPAYVNLRARDGFDPLYYDYYFKTQYWSMAFFAHGKGVSFDNRWTLSAGDVLHYFIPAPPENEQRMISRFLKKQCDIIDKTIEDTETSIAEYKSLKQSIITNAVTNGIAKDAVVVESGIEWIGKIPKGWRIMKIGQLFSERSVKVSDKDYKPLSVTMSGILPQLSTAAKTEAHDDRKLVLKGDFVINSRSDRRGSCGISQYDGSVSLINTVLKPRVEIETKYFGWLFKTPVFSDEYYKWGHGIVDDLWTTNWQDMKKILIPVPSIEEQEQISSILDSRIKRIDSIISQKSTFLDELNQYKKSIIYEYITGKKEVPEL